MGIAQRVKDFFSMESFATEQVQRVSAMQAVEYRSAYGAAVIRHQQGRPQWPKRSVAIYDGDAYRKIALIFRCVNLMASAVASAPLRVYQDLDQQPQEVADHPLRGLMQRPNPQMGEATFKAQLITTMITAGFVVIEKERSMAGLPVNLWALRSDWIFPIPREGTAPDWEYRIPGNLRVTIKAEDVIVLTFADTADFSPTGIGPLEVALREWGLLNTMQDFLKTFFDNGALPVYGIVPNDDIDMTKEEKQLAQEMWVERTSYRAGQPQYPPIMDGIKDIKRLSFDYNELAYVDLRDVSEIAICQAFGIPGSMVGQRYAQERNTFSNYGEARTSFYEDTVVPLWDRIDDALTLGLIQEFDSNPARYLAFDKSRIKPLQEDEVIRRAHMLDAMKAGAVTRADYKRAANLPVDQADDVYLVPFNIVEIPSGSKAQARAIPRSTITVRPMNSRSMQAPDRRAFGLVTMEQRQSIERRADRLYTKTANDYAPTIYQWFQGQKRRLLDSLSERSLDNHMEQRVSVDIALDWAAESSDFERLIRQLWNLIGGVATGETNTLLGTELQWDTSNPWVRQVLEDVGPRVTSISETTRNDIRRIVGAAVEEGVTMQDLEQRLSGLYEESYYGRSESIARTESMNAYCHATVAGYEESGEIREVELLDNSFHTESYGASDGLTCSERDGLIVPLEDARKHIAAEHPRGSLAISGILARPLGEV